MKVIGPGGGASRPRRLLQYPPMVWATVHACYSHGQPPFIGGAFHFDFRHDKTEVQFLPSVHPLRMRWRIQSVPKSAVFDYLK